MKIAVIGGGALGSLLAAKLSPLADLWLVTGWAEHAATIRQRGLELIRLDGIAERLPVQVAEEPTALGGKVALALVTVKSHDTRRAAEKARWVLAANGIALTLQNGLGNLETLAEVVGAGRAAQGVTAMGATLLGPGRVRHAGAGPTTLAGPPALAARLARVAKLFRAAGLETHLAENLDGLVWGKLAVNAGINALTAILRVPNGALMESPPAHALMAAAALETAAVARARGVQLPYDDPVAQVAQVATATAQNRSSMLHDVLRGAPTEIEVINAAVVREGERLGVPTPVNAMLAELVRALEGTAGQRL